MPGPQNLVKLNQERSSLKFGPDFCPKLGEDQKKRSSLKFGRVGPKLDGPPGPGTMYPLNPPSRRPCDQVGRGHDAALCPPIYAIVISEVNLANKKLKI